MYTSTFLRITPPANVQTNVGSSNQEPLLPIDYMNVLDLSHKAKVYVVDNPVLWLVLFLKLVGREDLYLYLRETSKLHLSFEKLLSKP